MSDEEIQAEPVVDEFILARQAEAAEAEDRRIRAITALKELRAEAEDRAAPKLMRRLLAHASNTPIFRWSKLLSC
jgi:hypothetical protein